MLREPVGIAGDRAENSLGDILGAMGVAAEPADGGGIHEGQMASDEFGKRLFGSFGGIAAKQGGVVEHARYDNNGTESKTGQESCGGWIERRIRPRQVER